jgi:hypothetical protein
MSATSFPGFNPNAYPVFPAAPAPGPASIANPLGAPQLPQFNAPAPQPMPFPQQQAILPPYGQLPGVPGGFPGAPAGQGFSIQA